MEITSTQRLILANQYKLMALLDKENARKYQRLETIVRCGFGLELAELDKEFSDLSEPQCRMVLEVLEMYNALQVSYNHLKDQTAISAHRLKFPGFCALTEKKYLNYLRFITQVEDKYSEFVSAPHSGDAQTPMVEKYAKMLKVLRSCPHEYHLSVAEIQNILNA